ncbi:hypothetical protein BVRB_5g119230 [Beta vulgaris subsp. vulgaris]|nr:hypothetical protein BVRB_5g119230 [Beta vulgaris subsp. vulgaris]
MLSSDGSGGNFNKLYICGKTVVVVVVIVVVPVVVVVGGGGVRDVVVVVVVVVFVVVVATVAIVVVVVVTVAIVVVDVVVAVVVVAAFAVVVHVVAVDVVVAVLVVVFAAASLDPMINDQVIHGDEKCEHYRDDEKFPSFGHVSSGFISQRCVRELKLLSSPSSLATILLVLALKNSKLQATSQFQLVDFSTSRFSYLREISEVLLRESHESPRNVTVQQIMSLESQASKVRWDCSCGKMQILPSVVRYPDHERLSLFLPLPSAIKFF